MKSARTFTPNRAKIILVAIVACATVFDMADVLGQQCSTGTCSNVVHKAAVVHNQAYVAPVHHVEPLVSQHVYYFVGAPVRAEAILEETKLSDPDYQEFLEFKEWRAKLREHDAPPADPGEPPRFSSTASIVQASCVSCHNAENTKGGLDLTKPFDEATKFRMYLRAAKGEMPPNNPFDDGQLGELLIELDAT